jgi:hypothetical protein
MAETNGKALKVVGGILAVVLVAAAVAVIVELPAIRRYAKLKAM